MGVVIGLERQDIQNTRCGTWHIADVQKKYRYYHFVSLDRNFYQPFQAMGWHGGV